MPQEQLNPQHIATSAIVAALLAMVGLLACASNVPRPTAAFVKQAQVRWPEATLASLQAGRALYIKGCARCHTLYRPWAVPAAEWPETVLEMAKRAKLDPQQAERVVRYLIVTSDLYRVEKKTRGVAQTGQTEPVGAPGTAVSGAQ